MRTRLLLAILLCTLGCGGDNTSDEDGLTLSLIGTRVRMGCFGGDCNGIITRADGGIHIGVVRTIDGVSEQRVAVVPLVTDVEVNMGAGADVFRILDYYTEGTLRVAMGGGDDLIDLDDGAARGTTRLDLGSGHDRLQSNASLPAPRFRIDAGPGDDNVALDHVPFPNANVVLGGEGSDILEAPPNLVEHAEVAGFEERVIF